MKQEVRTTEPEESPSDLAGTFDVLIIGAGFGGLALLRKLRDLGFSVRVLEAASGPGGTWFANRYPGARCDVESLQYSYQFSAELQQEWQWTERYAAQPEILDYVNHVVERFDLAKDISFCTRVTSAVFCDDDNTWTIDTQQGGQYRANHCILATGPLSSTNMPDIPGLGQFQGTIHHTGAWPHEPVSFEGQRVVVVGTGSSGIQAIPMIAREAEQLYVMQRTAGYCVPARNRQLDSGELEAVTSSYAELRTYWRSLPAAMGRTFPPPAGIGQTSALAVSDEEREQVFEAAWADGGSSFARCFSDLTTNAAASRLAAGFIGRKIAETVKDPVAADLLTPRQLFGTKRLCLDIDYYETYNRPNVTLVDVSASPITEVTETGIRAGDQNYDVDAIVFATGFDAMTGAILSMDVRGRRGLALADAWAAGPKTYLGLGVAGFPNLFIVAGPGSPAVLSNVITAIEHQVDWIADCLVHMRAHGIEAIEAEQQAQQAWVKHVNEISKMTLFWEGNSWYLGANIVGKPRVFMPYVGFPAYVAKCSAAAASGYEGFALSPQLVPAD